MCDPNFQACCGLIINTRNRILPETSSFCQPVEDFTPLSYQVRSKDPVSLANEIHRLINNKFNSDYRLFHLTFQEIT